MKGVFWVFNFSKHALSLSDHITASRDCLNVQGQFYLMTLHMKGLGTTVLNSVFVHVQYPLTIFFQATMPYRTCIFKN